jgi:hypothetical protein
MKAASDYDIALSFAGEDRAYVDRVANVLCDRGIKVFYDRFEVAELWGKDLYTHLTDIYQKRARFTVMFISQALWKEAMDQPRTAGGVSKGVSGISRIHPSCQI